MNAVLTRIRTAFVRRLHEVSGDSLVESLAALLIAVLGATLLATMVVASMNVASSTTSALATSYDQQSALTQMSDSQSVAISLATDGGLLSSSVEVHVYRSEDQTYSRYESAASSEGGGGT